MLKIILGFLPWIIYFVLVGTTRQQHEIAIMAALVTTFVLDFHELKKGFILTWGTAIFFTLLLAVTLFISSDWLEIHANLIANSALAVIVWISLIINQPFTLQYAREQVAKEFWQTPSFLRINQIITLVWGIIFLFSIGLNILQLYSININNWLYQTLSYAPVILAIGFTKKFPDWYKQRLINRSINQAEKLQQSNPFLKDNFAPVLDELNVEDLSIEGEIPKDLLGIYMRNGPNPAFAPFSYTYPFDGDGMLHAVYFKDGKASYRNRFIETDQLQVERRVGKAMYGGVDCPFIRDSKLLQPGDPTFPVKMGRFIHIIRHAERYLALHEAISAYEVNAQLATLGEWNPAPTKEAIAVNPHTRLDPETGELFLIAYHVDKPIIDYHMLDKDGNLIHTGHIDVPHCYMIHDFVLTKNYIIIFLCPVIIDLAGRAKEKHFFNWRPELNTRIALLSRTNPTQKIIWIESEAFFSYHFANAHEVGDEIIVDHVRYPKFSMAASELNLAHLYRTSINIKQKKCVHQQMDEHNVEFPRINENHNSYSYRYVYTPANLKNKNSDDTYNGLIKYDLKTGASTIHDFGSQYEIGEAVYVPKINSRDEDDGYLMLFTYNRLNSQSDLVLLDAKNLTDKPIARIHMPRRIPHGLHGSWMSGQW